MTKETKQPRKIMLREVVPYFVLSVLMSLAAGVILGYFLHVNIVGDARASVHQDIIQAAKVSKDSKPQQ